MEMNGKPSADLGGPDGVATDELAHMLDGLPDAARAATEGPDVFWVRQRALIRSRIAVEQATKRPLTKFVLISAFALLVMAILLVRSSPAPPRQAQGDPDQELLLAVEEALHSNVPEALAPASLLAEEMNSAQVQPRPAAKEKSNEN